MTSTPEPSPATTLHVDGPIARIELNRPDVRNAMSVELLAGLHECVDQLHRRDDVTVCVITGAGRAFCAGMDLKQIVIATDDQPGSPADTPLQLLTSLAELTLKVRTLPCVTVARVNGAAIGGGCGLACVCDLAVTHADAKLGFPEVDLGLCPAVVAPWLVKKIGSGPARAMLLQGGVMSGTQAHQRGLVEHLAESREELEPVVAQLTERLATSGPAAMRATKGLLNQLDGSAEAEAVREGARLSASVVVSRAAQAVLRGRLQAAN